MDQMEYKFTNFIFLGATPIDFKDINFNGINDIDFSKIMKEGNAKKNKAMSPHQLIGLIFEKEVNPGDQGFSDRDLLSEYLQKRCPRCK